jgi:hypothetical protein
LRIRCRKDAVYKGQQPGCGEDRRAHSVLQVCRTAEEHVYSSSVFDINSEKETYPC